MTKQSTTLPTLSPASAILCESMTALEFNGLKIRCWREEDMSYFRPDEPKIEIETLLMTFKEGIAPKDIALTLLNYIDRMNAVEVTNSFGNGIVLYSSWP